MLEDGQEKEAADAPRPPIIGPSSATGLPVRPRSPVSNTSADTEPTAPHPSSVHERAQFDEKSLYSAVVGAVPPGHMAQSTAG